MSDLIDRDALMKEFTKFVRRSNNHDYAPVPTWNDAVSLVGSMPSAEPERRWIPVTEALPEEEKDVLVSVHFDGYKDEYINYPPSDYVEIASHIDGVWSSIYDDFKTMRRHHHIVAWMEKPKPYRGE